MSPAIHAFIARCRESRHAGPPAQNWPGCWCSVSAIFDTFDHAINDRHCDDSTVPLVLLLLPRRVCRPCWRMATAT